MAQTKTKKAKSSTRSKPKGSRKATASRSNGTGTGAKAVREAVDTGKEAGQATAQAVGKAKVPLLAAGAVLVGAAGGVAYGASKSGAKVLGIRMPQAKRVKIRSRDLTKAAKEVRTFGDQVSELTDELKRIRKGMAKA